MSIYTARNLSQWYMGMNVCEFRPLWRVRNKVVTILHDHWQGMMVQLMCCSLSVLMSLKLYFELYCYSRLSAGRWHERWTSDVNRYGSLWQCCDMAPMSDSTVSREVVSILPSVFVFHHVCFRYQGHSRVSLKKWLWKLLQDLRHHGICENVVTLHHGNSVVGSLALNMMTVKSMIFSMLQIAMCSARNLLCDYIAMYNWNSRLQWRVRDKVGRIVASEV